MATEWMNDKQREIVAALEAGELGKARMAGGYPGIVSADIPGHVIIAGADENGEPELDIFEIAQLEGRWDVAHQDEDYLEAIESADTDVPFSEDDAAWALAIALKDIPETE